MSQFGGALRAVVLDNNDPDNRGRVRVRLSPPGAPGRAEYDEWTPVATFSPPFMQDAFFTPNVSDEVLVVFEGGDPRRPYVIGGLWSTKKTPPEAMDSENRSTLRSRGGMKVTLDDSGDRQRVIVETHGGQKITLEDGPGSVELLDSNGNSISLQANGIVVNATSKVTINASQVEVNANTVNVNSGMSKFSGVIQCDTLISNSVVSASYSPGAGNVW